jgi:hypothetical protein
MKPYIPSGNIEYNLTAMNVQPAHKKNAVMRKRNTPVPTKGTERFKIRVSLQ